VHICLLRRSEVFDYGHVPAPASLEHDHEGKTQVGLTACSEHHLHRHLGLVARNLVVHRPNDYGPASIARGEVTCYGKKALKRLTPHQLLQLPGVLSMDDVELSQSDVLVWLAHVLVVPLQQRLPVTREVRPEGTTQTDVCPLVHLQQLEHR